MVREVIPRVSAPGSDSTGNGGAACRTLSAGMGVAERAVSEAWNERFRLVIGRAAAGAHRVPDHAERTADGSRLECLAPS